MTHYLHADKSFLPVPDGDFSLSFPADGEGINFFTPAFEQETEITGPVAGSFAISSTTDDADVFLTMRVLNPDGRNVSFVSANDSHGVIATGWLRASHRKLDKNRSTFYRPVHTHDEKQPYGRQEKTEKDALDDDPDRNPGHGAAMVFHHHLDCQRYLVAVYCLGAGGCSLGNHSQQVLFKSC